LPKCLDFNLNPSIAMKNLTEYLLFVLITFFSGLSIVSCTSVSDQKGAAYAQEANYIPMEMILRSQEKDADNKWQVKQETQHWNPGQTAIIITDMWDEHWCESATQRVGELAPHMNEVVSEARKLGVTIIHAPSGTMDTYADYPQRKKAQELAHHPAPEGFQIENWCYLDPEMEDALPIDDTDGGCDKPCADGQPCKERTAWTSQISVLEIQDGDYITDRGQEVYNLIMEKGIENIIVMGVHINMCILGRPFAIRQLSNLKKNVVLMRDMTDAMYNPASEPYVTHFRGTELVTEHIERYWAPTVLSTDITGKKAFRFSEDDRVHIAMLIAENEYDARKTLPEFAAKQLTKGGHYAFNIIEQSEGDTVDAVRQIQDADLLWIYVRRRHLPEYQLAYIRQHIAAGKPVLAMRTSSHAFETWKEFDAEILGGNYHNHHPQGPDTWAIPINTQLNHPILEGLGDKPFEVISSLYKTKPLAADVQPLIMGRYQDQEEEPIAWIRKVGNAKIFYTSLGHRNDFDIPQVNKMILNAMEWLTER
jgi:type 1 glutamine amidotransferase/nicotinamidase-related amidase